jgi:hypothetical protein
MHNSLVSMEREVCLEILSELNCPCCAGEVWISTSGPSTIMPEKALLSFKHESSSSQETNFSDLQCSVTVLYTQ